jgi:hypothetical protein
MTKLRAVVIALLAIVGMGMGLAPSAETQQNHSLTFKFKSDYKYKVQVAFFAQERKHVWPGNNEAYNLDDSRVHEFRLSCHRNERICYGGWVTGNAKLFWGRGAQGKLACESCCYRCNNDETPVIRLHN